MLAGIILCGGKSSRMGRPKATLPFGNGTMIEHMVSQLKSVAQPIVVVTSEFSPVLPKFSTEVLLTEDQFRDCGPLAGIHAGLRRLEALSAPPQAAFITSCDAPLLQSALVMRLDQERKQAGAKVAVPLDGKFHHPLNAVYELGLSDTIASLLEAGNRRPIALYSQVATQRIPIDELRDADPELLSFLNLNTQEDYQRALDIYSN